jgi:structural maintenance of chromosome 2
MFEKAESECHDLMKKKEIIVRDKSKIVAVIEELDRKKNAALETTWRKGELHML